MTLEEIIQRFESLAHGTQTLTFVPRDIELQTEALSALNEFSELLSECKAAFVEAAEEDSANQTLAVALIVSSLASELRMYIDLKTDQPEAAWDHLVDAQHYAAAAMRAHSIAGHLTNHLAKLEAIERLLFPPQAFVSIGSIVRTTECSICGDPYDECSHVVGRPYMGSLCAVVCKDVEVHEVSFVTEPADKRCRVTHFSDSSGRRNKMTWRLDEK